MTATPVIAPKVTEGTTIAFTSSNTLSPLNHLPTIGGAQSCASACQQPQSRGDRDEDGILDQLNGDERFKGKRQFFQPGSLQRQCVRDYGDNPEYPCPEEQKKLPPVKVSFFHDRCHCSTSAAFG